MKKYYTTEKYKRYSARIGRKALKKRKKRQRIIKAKRQSDKNK